MKKRVLSFVLAVLAVFSLMSVTVFASGQDGQVIDLSGGNTKVIEEKKTEQPKEEEMKIEEPKAEEKKEETKEEKEVKPELKEEKAELPEESVQNAMDRVEEVGKDIAKEDSPLVSFSFSSVFSFVSDMFRAARDFFSSFFTILFNGQYGG